MENAVEDEVDEEEDEEDEYEKHLKEAHSCQDPPKA
jgi:serine/threonine-protein kinase SRK2